MKLNDRPIILARLIQRDGVWYLENHITQVVIEDQYTGLVTDIYTKANGQYTLDELASFYPSEDIVGFFEQLEVNNLAQEILSVSMIGHNFADYPDFTRLEMSEEEVLKLQKLPCDTAIDNIRLGVNNDTTDVARHTQRKFTPEPISWVEFQMIILSAYGITSLDSGESSRSIPSAGAMYPLIHTFFVLNVENLDVATYRLSFNSNSIYILGNDPHLALVESMLDEEWRSCAIVHVISFDITRSSAKYGSRAHRFAILEAGHSAQNAIRKATTLGIGTWEFGGYNDKQLSLRLGLTGSHLGIATVIFYGKVAK